MSSPKGPLPSQPRSRSLDDLDAEIIRGEVVRTRWETRVRSLETAGLDASYVRGLLGIAIERLAQLNRSRDVLLGGEEGEDGEPEAAS
jgi:hypothetical protein